jgi:hypothetical protein
MKRSMDDIYSLHEKDVSKLRKNKYWKKGYEAAKKKLTRQDNPYKLSDEIRELLKKRTYWDIGWEEKAYTPSKKQIESEKRKHDVSKRDKEKHKSDKGHKNKHR